MPSAACASRTSSSVRERDLRGQLRAQRGREIGHLVVDARPGTPSARPAARGTRARRRACVIEERRGPRHLWWQRPCDSPSTSPTPASPPAAPPRLIIADGRVTVDGAVVTDPARDVDDERRVKVDGKRVRTAEPERVVYLLNKPAGVVSTAQGPAGPADRVDARARRERLYPVGRLDYDTTGLILLTNDGDLAHRLTHPSLRGPAHLPRPRRQRAGPRARAALAARRRRARGRPDRAREGAQARLRTTSS